MSRDQLEKLLRGTAGVTPIIALKLERVLGSSAEMWMNMQTAYDLC